jgi:site-specific DNA recombinase
MKTDAMYCRYSSHAQDGGTSIEVQTEACRKAADGECREYCDKAKSGTAVAGRTALLKLLADAEAGQIGRLFVHKYDRLGRNLAETSAIIAQLEECGVEVISVTEGKDTLARGMHLVISEHYSRVLSERTRAGLVKRHEQRAWTGGPAPMGFQVVLVGVVRRLQINEDEVPVVRFIFERYLAGDGMKAVAKQLQAKGFKCRRSKHWMFTSVRAILTNECVSRIAASPITQQELLSGVSPAFVIYSIP